MIVATRQRQQLYELKLHLHISDKIIEQVQFHKVLGIKLDSEFKWLPHLENVLRLVSRNLFLLSQLKHYADEHSLKLFFMVIFCHMYLMLLLHGMAVLKIINLN